MADELINYDFKKRLAEVAKKIEEETRLKQLLEEGKSAGSRFLQSTPQTAQKVGDVFISGAEKAVLEGMDDTSKALVPYMSSELAPLSSKIIPSTAKELVPSTTREIAKNLASKGVSGASKLAGALGYAWPTAMDESPEEANMIKAARESNALNTASKSLEDFDKYIASQNIPVVSNPNLKKAVSEEQLKTRQTGEETPVDKAVSNIAKGTKDNYTEIEMPEFKAPTSQSEVQPVEKSDPLQSARTKDAIFIALNALNKAMAQKDAGALGKTGIAVKPVMPDDVKTNFEAKEEARIAREEAIKARQAQAAKLAEQEKFNKMLQLAGLDIRQKQLDIASQKTSDQSEQTALNRDLRKKIHDDKMKEKQEVSDKQLDALSSLDELTNRMNDVSTLRKKVSPGYWGQKAHEAGAYIPLLDIQNEDQAAMTSLVGKSLSDYIKSMSGLAVSDKEAARLAKNIPTMEDKPDIFDRKLQVFMKDLEDIKRIKKENIVKYQGKYIPPSESPKSEPLKTVQPKSNMVTVYSPSGTAKDVPANEVQAWLKRGATLEKPNGK